MRTARWALACVVVAMGSGVPALAAENELILADRPGRETVQANCSACHSLDYILTNASIQGRVGWEATVSKMIGIMGAPIAPEDASAIVAYLAASYGNGS